MSKLKITDLRKYLKTLSEKELQDEIVFLTKNYRDVKEYYSIKINPENEDEILKKYKKIVENEFFPDRGFGKMRYNVVRDAIRDFQKISKSPENVADLMLYYAENGVEFTNTYGDINEQFYMNIAKAYMKALEFVSKNDLEELCFERVQSIEENAQGIGWGFSDYMTEIYLDYMGHLEEYEEDEL